MGPFPLSWMTIASHQPAMSKKSVKIIHNWSWELCHRRIPSQINKIWKPPRPGRDLSCCAFQDEKRKGARKPLKFIAERFLLAAIKIYRRAKHKHSWSLRWYRIEPLNIQNSFFRIQPSTHDFHSAWSEWHEISLVEHIYNPTNQKHFHPHFGVKYRRAVKRLTFRDAR